MSAVSLVRCHGSIKAIISVTHLEGGKGGRAFEMRASTNISHLAVFDSKARKFRP